MSLEHQILDYVRAHPGKKARDIATSLGAERNEVNSLLYGRLKSKVRQDKEYRWFPSGDGAAFQAPQVETPERVDTPLAHLCRYYLECLSKDDQSGVSEFASSHYDLKYAELDSSFLTGEQDADILFSEEEPRRLVGAVRRERRKLTLYLGYPVLLKLLRSRKSNWEGFVIEPIFLWGFDTDEQGRFQLPSIDTDLPHLNQKALASLTGSTGMALMDEAITLMDDLGLAGTDTTVPELDELMARLHAMHPDWEWCEYPDPESLSEEPPLSKIETPGIYNRAVIVLAERSPYTVGLESELGNLQKVAESDYRDTALGQWIRGDIPETAEESLGSTIEVVPLNSEQREAVEKGLTESLAVITGPPGTGKSQVVTALLTNAAWRGMRVLFASKNNKAVDVVEQRVNGLGSRPILLRTGRDEYQSQLAEYLAALQGASTTREDEENYEQARVRLDKMRGKIEYIDRAIERTLALRNEIDAQEERMDWVREALGAKLFSRCRQANVQPLEQSAQALKAALAPAIRANQPLATRLFWFVVSGKRYRLLVSTAEAANPQARWSGGSFPSEQPSDETIEKWTRVIGQFETRVALVREAREYFDKLTKLNQSRPVEDLHKELVLLQQNLADQSLEFWDYWLHTVPGSLDQRQRRLIGEYVSTLRLVLAAREQSQGTDGNVRKRYKQLFPQVVSILPCWAVTSLAARGRIPLEPHFFDLVIIDEASQCDIASIIPLLYRAKRAIIIGDPQQLKHIASLHSNVDQTLLEKHKLVEGYSTWNYSQNSVFDLASSLCLGRNVVSLRDHHRSHADIIGFSNRTFYEGRLRVATKYDRLVRPPHDGPAVRWIDVRGRAHRPATGSLVNDVEAKSVVEELRRLVLEQGYRGTVGVVSPFRAQVNRIRDLVAQDGALDRAVNQADFIADTAHGFQGDERDVILFSPVLTSEASDSSKRFLGKTRNLFNVAITRARAALVIVGDEGAARNGGIPLLTDFARYVSELRDSDDKSPSVPEEDLGPEYPAVTNPADVSDWERLLYRILCRAGIRTIPQYVEEKYRLDLALIDGARKLDIEVDGEHHRNPWTGELSRRDLIRNQRLMELGWDVMRFWVYQLRDDMDWCVDRVRLWKEVQ